MKILGGGKYWISGGDVFALAVVLLLLMIAPIARCETIILPGVACRPGWNTNLRLLGDASSTGSPWALEIKYRAVEFPGDARTFTASIAESPAVWRYDVDDFVCREWGHLGPTSGVLIITAPFDVTGYALVSSRGFGAAVPRAVPVDPSRPIVVPEFGSIDWRCNVILYVDNDRGATIMAGLGEVVLPPHEPVILHKVASGTVIWTEPNVDDQYVLVSMVNNFTGDPHNLDSWVLSP